MQRYEYKVIPAPTKGLKAKGVKGPEARFAHAIETAMNDMGRTGWTYLRADILPSEERQGLTSTTTVYRTLLVFQRPAGDAPEAPTEVTKDVEAADDGPVSEDESTAQDADDTAAPSPAPLAASLTRATEDEDDAAEPEDTPPDREETPTEPDDDSDTRAKP